MAAPYTAESRSTRSLERLSVDPSPQRPVSAGDVQFLIVIFDDYSQKGRPYFLKRKSDVPMAVAGVVVDINANGVSSIVRCVIWENGTEFSKPEIVAWLNEPGIRRKCSLVGFPKHYGVVERWIAMTLGLGMASRFDDAVLFGEFNMPPTQPLWVEAR